jgi:hypothetical protein
MTAERQAASLAPGRWTRTQTHGGKVLQYAWRCPTCRTTEWVLCMPAREIEDGDRREWCKECGKSATVTSGERA